VWLLFVFHHDEGACARSKIKPPRLDGLKTGVYSTRSPHRPNQIGLSLVRLIGIRRHAPFSQYVAPRFPHVSEIDSLSGVSGDTLHLSGVDLVNETPVLDVKPYVPFCDAPAAGVTPSVAPWLAELPTPDLNVSFDPTAETQLRELVPQLRWFKSEERARAAIVEVLTADPRSVHWRQSRADLEYGFSLDMMNVVCRFGEDGARIVLAPRPE